MASCPEFPHEDGAGDRDVERFDGLGAGQRDQARAGFGDFGGEAVLLVAEDERDGRGGGSVDFRAAAACGGADDIVAGGAQGGQKCGQRGDAPDGDGFEAAFGDAVGGVVGARGGRGIGDDQVAHAEKRGGAGERAEVVCVAHAVEDEQRLFLRGPCGELARWRGLQLGRIDDGHDAAVVHGAGDFFELGGGHAAIDAAAGGEGTADGADAAARGFVEEQAFDGGGIALPAGLDGGEAAEREFVFVHVEGSLWRWARGVEPGVGLHACFWGSAGQGEGLFFADRLRATARVGPENARFWGCSGFDPWLERAVACRE